MASTKNVFILGPGFIGWNVLEHLVRENYSVIALVRRPQQVEGIKESGAAVIEGRLEDHDLIKRQVSRSDIVIHTATADHLVSVQAVLDGIRARAKEGKKTIYIHTSGTGVLDDGAAGEFAGEKIYYDNKPEDIDALPDTAPHRNVDLTIVKAAREIGPGFAKIAIMIPPEIYGFNYKHKRLTIQLPTIARFALKHGYPGHVGKGLSIESQIHVLDLTRAYLVLLHHMEEADGQEFIKNPYFFCENGEEFTWKEVAEAIGKSLWRRGLLEDPTPKPFEEKDYDELFGPETPAVIGLNSRSRAVRLRELGWSPREKSIWESLDADEIPELLREEGVAARSSRYTGFRG